MKFLDKLILLCVALFVGITVSVASADTEVQQKAKRTGLNTASPNQMLTQQLGTELIAKSPRLVVLTYNFTTNPAVSGTTITFKDKYTGQTGKIPSCHIVADAAKSAAFVSAPSDVAVSGTPVLAVEGGAFSIASLDVDAASSLVNAGYAYGLTLLQGVIGCDGDTTITADVTGGDVTSGVLDITLEALPYNQTK